MPRPDPGQVAHRVEGDLGVVGAGLHTEVAAAFPLVQLVAGQRRELAQGRRPVAAQAEAAALEQARPEAEGDGEAGGKQADRLAGVVGRGERDVVRIADQLPRGHLGGGPGPLLQQFAQLRTTAVDEVEGGEVEAVLGRGRDPRLVLAVEGDAAGALACCGVLAAHQVAHRAAEPDARGPNAGRGQ